MKLVNKRKNRNLTPIAENWRKSWLKSFSLDISGPRAEAPPLSNVFKISNNEESPKLKMLNSSPIGNANQTNLCSPVLRQHIANISNKDFRMVTLGKRRRDT